MRVAYFAESLPPNEDGVSKTLLKLSDYLDRNQIDYRFISPFKPESSHYLYDRVKKVSYIPFPMYSQYRLSLPFLNGVKYYLDRFRPDILHLTSPTPLGLFTFWYGNKRNIPVVSTYHTHFISYFKYYGLKYLEGLGWRYTEWFYNQCDITHVPTLSIKEELEDHGVENIEHIPHGIETEHFSPDKKNQELREIFDNNYPILLFVGRLVKEKDLDDLVEVNRELKNRQVKFNMVFVGSGPMTKELKRKLPQAHFTGHLTDENLFEWFATGDVFAYPSTTETFGLVVQEAFSSGVPVVGVDKGGVGSLIKDGETGFLFSVHDIETFADKCEKLLKNKEMRQKMGKTARQNSLNNSWDKVNRRVILSYQNLIKKHR
ncbi:MAG: glycosyltransferase family 1 protein [Candidatus Marinimicrobia bacterium]|nr:glycosyltransferase family 1 protein [Candidatus Neomarinimicrobiota bacterium]